MTDQVRVLLLNPSDAPGYRHVSDAPSDVVMALFGADGGSAVAEAAVDRLMPLALAPDLSRFRRFYDPRVTPPATRSVSSVYRQAADALSPAGLYDRVLGSDGWWRAAAAFQHEDPAVAAVLGEMREAATGGDAPYALGAVLLAVAYRRWLLQGGGG